MKTSLAKAPLTKGAPEYGGQATAQAVHRENILEALSAGNARQEAGNVEIAEDIYWKILSFEPDNPDALYRLGTLCGRNGDSTKAAALIGRAVQAAPDKAHFRTDLGLALQQLDRIDEAMEQHRTAIELDPADARAHGNLGHLLKEFNEDREAAEWLESSIRLNPGAGSFHKDLASLYLGFGQLDDAERLYREHLRLLPHDAEAEKSLAELLETRGRATETQRITSPAPASGVSHLGLAIVCPMANERDSAIPFVRSVLEEAADFRDVVFLAVLDNVCKDGTTDLLREYASTEPRLRVVWAPENRSVVDAYKRGYREALATGFEWILEIDAGFSHQPTDLRNFLKHDLEAYDCLFGSRFCTGGRITDSSFKRRLISRGGTILTNLLLGTRMADMTSGYEMFRRGVLQSILDKGINSRGHFFQTEIKVHCRNLRHVEVPIHYRAASNSVNGATLKDALVHLFGLFRQRITGAI